MLNLNDLDTDDIPGITRVKGSELAQAGAICLESLTKSVDLDL